VSLSPRSPPRPSCPTLPVARRSWLSRPPSICAAPCAPFRG
jgi:hypothetical protein